MSAGEHGKPRMAWAGGCFLSRSGDSSRLHPTIVRARESKFPRADALKSLNNPLKSCVILGYNQC